MPAPKKKKKKASGGATGAPPRSEPRIQVFSKFSGCNFQLAQRDFDAIFDEGQDAQTDLMPTLMAIQNNAAVVPFGGIETRQSLVKLFDAPLDASGNPKHLTGVATLVGDELYVACDDMTVHYGTLPADGALGDLNSDVTITDNNDTYAPAVETAYSGTTTVVTS